MLFIVGHCQSPQTTLQEKKNKNKKLTQKVDEKSDFNDEIYQTAIVLSFESVSITLDCNLGGFESNSRLSFSHNQLKISFCN